MPNKNKEERSDGAHVLFTELIVCRREGDVFYAGGRSNKYKRTGAMTADYVRELVTKLSALLAEYDAERGIQPPAFDGITLSRDGDGLSFSLTLNDKPAASGRVTKDVAKKAKAFLNDYFPGPKIIRGPWKTSAHALAWIVPLLLVA